MSSAQLNPGSAGPGSGKPLILSEEKAKHPPDLPQLHLRAGHHRDRMPNKAEMSPAPGVQQAMYGELPDGREVQRYTLTNAQGLQARVMEYGAILVSMHSPDRSGSFADLTHGFDTLEDWVHHNNHYFGATVGRYGNRIAHGKFSLEGLTYQLALNNAPGGVPCALHGGNAGFDKVLWSGRIVDERTVEFSYTSADGEEGYPGTLHTRVSYTLNDDNELIWQATATTDAPTIINIIHHSYWNLSGNPSQSILDHELTLKAAHYLPTQEDLIPTGKLNAVAGTPMDFTSPHRIGARLNAGYEALRHENGYDHCFVLEHADGIRTAAILEDPSSGRRMEILTDQPGIQLYTANYLDGSLMGKGGTAYPRCSALCLETQNFPNAPNHPDFPSCVLRPNETYRHTLIHRFSSR